MRSASEVIRCLVAQGLIAESQIVEGNLEISELPRRHLGMRIRHSAGGLFCKLATVAEHRAALRNEANVYNILGHWAGDGAAAGWLPGFLGFDTQHDLLTLELIDAPTMREYALQSGKVSETLATQLGESLAALHDIDEPCILSTLEHRHPWSFELHSPSYSFFNEFSAATRRLVRTIQGDRYTSSTLQRLEQDWRCSSVIHHDLRWDNCLVNPSEPELRVAGLKIIDWELAGLGDPLWDVAGAVSEYLYFWLLSIPFVGDNFDTEWTKFAKFPLSEVRPAIRALWVSYVRNRKRRGEISEESGIRLCEFVAARLLQSSIEQAQLAVSPSMISVLALQLASNILSDPKEAQVSLLGLAF